MVYVGLNIRSESDPKFENFASFRSAMLFILSSIFHQNHIKNGELCLAPLPCDLCWLKSPVNIRPKIRELYLASLGHVVYFGINLLLKFDQKSGALPRFAGPCGLFWLKSPVKIRRQEQIKNSNTLPRFVGHVDYFGFNDSSK